MRLVLCQKYDTGSDSVRSIRYYSKRPFVKDRRLALLPSNFFWDAVVLDIGCNEGWVTCEIGKYRTFEIVITIGAC